MAFTTTFGIMTPISRHRAVVAGSRARDASFGMAMIEVGDRMPIDHDERAAPRFSGFDLSPDRR